MESKMILEYKNKTYHLIDTLKFEEVEVIFKHTRKYIEITERMQEATSPAEYNSLYAPHVKALDDKHGMIKVTLKRCLGLEDKEIRSMDYGEVNYLFNRVIEMTLILS
jgi:hypothetical protein